MEDGRETADLAVVDGSRGVDCVGHVTDRPRVWFASVRPSEAVGRHGELSWRLPGRVANSVRGDGQRRLVAVPGPGKESSLELGRRGSRRWDGGRQCEEQ